ncbi:MAG: hypothetical protein P8P89_04345, partial [Paracoccaceae bacterium]|nr:hypothetical protein [Paracoccaceae bacterium]
PPAAPPPAAPPPAAPPPATGGDGFEISDDFGSGTMMVSTMLESSVDGTGVGGGCGATSSAWLPTSYQIQKRPAEDNYNKYNKYNKRLCARVLDTMDIARIPIPLLAPKDNADVLAERAMQMYSHMEGIDFEEPTAANKPSYENISKLVDAQLYFMHETIQGYKKNDSELRQVNSKLQNDNDKLQRQLRDIKSKFASIVEANGVIHQDVVDVVDMNR